MKGTKPVHAIGRRKCSVARVFVRPGTGSFMVNGKELKAFFPTDTLRNNVVRPLIAVDKLEGFDLVFNIEGGGTSGQAGAARLALARALVKIDQSWKAALRKEGFMTVDPRVVERKKYGRHKARRRPQFSKR